MTVLDQHAGAQPGSDQTLALYRELLCERYGHRPAPSPGRRDTPADVAERRTALLAATNRPRR